MNKIKPLSTWSFTDWEVRFKPILNHIDNHAAYNGYMFETYDTELHYVKSQQHKHVVWTLQESEKHDGLVICEGFHSVDRVGYFITEIPYNPRCNYNIDTGIG